MKTTKTTQETQTDDFGYPCTQMRVLPTGGDGNAIVGKRGYDREMAFRKERIKEGVPFDLPSWESLSIYWEAGK